MPETTFSRHRELVASAIEGRRWICAHDVLVAAAAAAEQLLGMGAAGALAIGGSRGTGTLPDPRRVPQILLETTGSDVMTAIRAAQAALADLPAEVRRRVDAFDPDGSARVLGAFYASGDPVAGRRAYGARPRAWQALEDKVVIDGVWDRAEIARVPVAIVEVEEGAIRRAATEVAGGPEYVLAGDAREGFNGGAEYVRWIRGPRDLGPALEFFGARCDRVRVMPFLEGLPCSVHGIVLPDHVAVLRPCELLVFRDTRTPAFRYAGSATFWNAPAELTGEMRAAARRLGEHLAAELGYRGVFTLDGVATGKGFRPTELNPRVGGALTTATRNLEALPITILNAVLVEGEELDWRGAELEALLFDYLESNRNGNVMQLVTRTVGEESGGALRLADGSWRCAAEGEPADASWSLGPGAVGGFLRVVLDPDRTPQGPPAGPRALGALRCVAGLLELEIGPLEAAGPVESL